MIQEKILHIAANYYIKNRDNRDTLKKIRITTCKLRGYRLPIYKNIFDIIHFRSYFVVLERVVNWKKPKICFEWGPGLNTELFANAGATVYSVEHDKEWFSIYNKVKPKNVTLIFSELQDNSFLDYPSEIKKIKEPIDLAFVDARCRVQCILSCKEKNVPVVVMHDSLHYVTMQPATDGAPPVFNEKRLCKEGYQYYKYFIEVVDLRTIILLEQEKDFKELVKIFNDFYIISGETIDYDNNPRKI